MLPAKSPASTSRATRRARCRATARARTLRVPMAMFVTRTVWQAGRRGTCIRSIPGPGRRLQVAQHRFVGHFVVHGGLQGHVPRQRQVEGACVRGRCLFLPVRGHGGGRHGQQARQQDQGRSHHGRVLGWCAPSPLTAWSEFSARRVAAACLPGGSVCRRVSMCVEPTCSLPGRVG